MTQLVFPFTTEGHLSYFQALATVKRAAIITHVHAIVWTQISTLLGKHQGARLLDCMITVLLPGKSHGRRSLVGCSPWGCEESDMTEGLHFHFSLLCIGEGNGNPLQCSCLENPRDGVAPSRTRPKWLSSSSSSTFLKRNCQTNFHSDYHFLFPPEMNENSCCSTSLQNLMLSMFWTLAIPIGVQCVTNIF